YDWPGLTRSCTWRLALEPSRRRRLSRRARVFQLADLLLKHLLHLAPGDEHRGHLHAQRRGPFGPRLALHRRPRERLPGARRAPRLPASRGLLEQLAIELGVQPPDEVLSRLDRREQLHRLAAAHRNGLAASPVVVPGVAGNRLEPGAEA